MTPVVEVLVLQHPLEVRNAKGSARLLHLSLKGSQMVTGEVFDGRLLLGLPGGETTTLQSPKYNILLYPDTPHDTGRGLPAPPVMVPGALHDASQLRLIVLDGTWRKSRKMLYLNPLLHHMPRLSMEGLPPSRYRVRKARHPDHLSTLEATCAALAKLEGGGERFQPVLEAFDGFVAQQLACRTGHERVSGC